MNDTTHLNGWRYSLKINATFWFWLICLLQATLWTLAPTFTRGNVPFDTIEGLAWGNQWQFGYDKHPPLAAWLTAGVTHLSGYIVGWPVYLLAQIAVITAFWSVWRLAKKIVPPAQALISVALLQGIIYYTLITPKFNPTTLMTPIWGLMIFIFYLALKNEKMWQWLLLGALTGLSILTKYQSALLIISMLGVMFFTEEGRKSFKNPSVYAGIVIAFLVMCPNIIWLFNHHFCEITYATRRVNSYTLHPAILNHIYYPIMFFLQQAGVIAPIFILFLPFYFCERATSTLPRFEKRFLIAMGLGPFLLTVLIALFFGSYLEPKWATPYFILAGLMWVLWYKPIVTQKALTHFAWIIVAVMLLTVGARSLFLLYGPTITGKARPDAYFPGKTIALQLTQAWHQRYHTQLRYVAGAHYVVANITSYSPDHPVPYFGWDTSHAAWINENDVRKQGALFVWFADRDGKTLPKNIKARFPNAIQMPVQYFKKMTTADVPPVALGVAFLPPKKAP